MTRAGGMASDFTVSTAGTTDAVMRVDVSATVVQVVQIPRLTWRIQQTAAGARERFTTPTVSTRP
nr:hypothetical protein [Kibdelosporangium sp. MJ126-NF4]